MYQVIDLYHVAFIERNSCHISLMDANMCSYVLVVNTAKKGFFIPTKL